MHFRLYTIPSFFRSTAFRPSRYPLVMAPPKASGETSRFFNSSRSSDARPLRRSARSSLAKSSYIEEDGSDSDAAAAATHDASDVSYGSDIEDAIKSKTPSPPPAGTVRKRKRTTTTTTTIVKPSPSGSPAVKAEITEVSLSSIPSPSKARRVRKPARVIKGTGTGGVKVEPPSDWEEMYALVKEMRLTGPAANAAVDTMGCERLAGKEASPRDRRFHTLVALMLSSQTKDTVNAEAMARLQKELPPHEEGAPPGLNLDNILAVEPALLNELIGKVGFHNNKTKYVDRGSFSLLFPFPPLFHIVFSCCGDLHAHRYLPWVRRSELLWLHLRLVSTAYHQTVQLSV